MSHTRPVGWSHDYLPTYLHARERTWNHTSKNSPLSLNACLHRDAGKRVVDEVVERRTPKQEMEAR